MKGKKKRREREAGYRWQLQYYFYFYPARSRGGNTEGEETREKRRPTESSFLLLSLP